MVGTGVSNDSQSVGYRMDALKSGTMTYNGYEFPPALHSKVTMVPEYDDASKVLKYLTIALNVQFVVTDFYHAPNEPQRPSTDAEMSGMYKRLVSPGQNLHFELLGLGKFNINSPSSGAYTPGATRLQDIDFGPKPQVLEIEPIAGGLATRVDWLCTTRIPACLSNENAILSQYSYSYSWSFDPSGFMIRTVEGNVGLPAILPSTTTPSEIRSTKVDDRSWQAAKELLENNFPLLPKFRRTQFYRLSTDRRSLNFKIEDTEIRSDNSFPPGVSDIEMSQNISSRLHSEGFTIWHMTISGRLETVNSKANYSAYKTKQLAFYWLGVLIRQRLADLDLDNQYKTDEEDKRDVVGYSTDTDMIKYARDDLGPALLPKAISITDSMFSNAIQFSISWDILNVQPQDILVLMKMFSSAHYGTSLQADTWVKFLKDTQAYDEYNNESQPPEIIVDLCHQPEEPTPRTERDFYSRPNTDGSFLDLGVIQKGDWKLYVNKFRFHTESYAVTGNRLRHDITIDYALDEYPKSFSIEDKSPLTGGENMISEGSTIQKEVEIDVSTLDTTYVVMAGYAERIGSPINPPVLIGIGNNITVNAAGKATAGADSCLAYRVTHPSLGGREVEPGEESTGLVRNGKRVKIHTLRWKQVYVLDKAPTQGHIHTSGHPKRFTG